MKERSRVCSARLGDLRLISLITISITLSAAANWAAEPEESFTTLFDGKTLNGWDGDSRYWRVENGNILGETTQDNPLESNTFLIWRGGDVGNFELLLEYRIVGGNSGIQYRSREDPEKWGKWVVGGYQADIDSSREPGWTGILYEERGRQFLAKRGQKTVIDDNHQPRVIGTVGDPVERQSHIKAEAWNTYHILAKDYHFVQKINGHVMIETTDNDKTARRERGLLALQLHAGDPMKIEFRNIRLKQHGGKRRFTQKPVVVQSVPRGSTSVSPNTFVLPPGFQVERLFTVPKEELGSWVSIAFDDQGRLIASDQQDKGLCRITPAPIGSKLPTNVERLDVDISSAQGMLCAFESLYLSVVAESGSGLYRARDTSGDDQYDEVVKLKDFLYGGEHSPHALRLSPDGNSIYLVSGNHTDLPEGAVSKCLPDNWGEDLLLPRQWDARGHAHGRLAPGGWIAKTDPDGNQWEVVSIGYRNSYDIAFNADGELFAYDSDMEWDLGLPWYRPTRIVHATHGSEFGWRSGTGKWPPYYVDSLPPMVDMGPGSPVGVTFGYGTKFPARYQRALLACDWTFGTMYAIDIQPHGASYKAVKEEFLSCTPLPLTDIAVGPDGAIYFTTGGRGTQSELFRLTYVGQESTEPVETRDTRFIDLRRLRRRLERLHSPPEDPAGAVDLIWPHLAHADRHIRYAARVALERQDVKLWQKRAFAETHPQALIAASVAMVRQGEKSLQSELIAALNQIDFGGLQKSQQLDLLRTYQLVFIRMGEPDDATALRVIKQFDPYYPSTTDALNRELITLLVYLKSPTVISKTLELLQQESTATRSGTGELIARNQEYGGPIAQMLANPPDRQKTYYAFVLRNLKTGWTLGQRKSYFDFLQKAREWSGGASYQGFITNLDREAFDNATESERLSIEASGARKPYQLPELPKPIGPGRDWTSDGLLTLAKDGLNERDFNNGQKMFLAARCIVCHRFAGDGGATGPDLTQAAGRFALKDLCEAIVDPSKTVPDQYRSSLVVTEGGKVYSGRIVNETNDSLTILIDPEDSTRVVTIARDEIDQSRPLAVSMMPSALLNPLSEREVLDLLAYLLSRGDASDPMFHK